MRATLQVAIPVEVPREFHRRMAAIIDAVQSAIWRDDAQELLGYVTDYSFGDDKVLQTLVLKSRHRSAYVRLRWDTVMGDSVAERRLVSDAIQSAVNELM